MQGIPGDILLKKIVTRHAYLDRKSVKESTVKSKQKYKLAGNSIKLFHYYSFFILTSHKDLTNKDLRVCIHKNDWIKKEQRYLNEEYSYTDPTQCEILSSNELLYKINDNKNGFHWAGELKNYKYEELILTCKKMRKIKIRPKEETIARAEEALFKETMIKLTE